MLKKIKNKLKKLHFKFCPLKETKFCPMKWEKKTWFVIGLFIGVIIS